MSTTPPDSADAVRRQLRRLANPDVAGILQRFFKTGPGQYGQGDRFLGIKVPGIRGITKAHRHLPLDEVRQLLNSPYHEERLAALFILVLQFDTADATQRQRIYTLYLKSTDRINNWDLVDCSAPHIIGGHLLDKDRQPLLALARSRSLWERRIAIIATLCFIRQQDFAPTLAIAELLLDDKQDLIHKATGWMLREVGKRSRPAAEAFLCRHCRTMPRTMLRYAIERFPQPLRQMYLAGQAATPVRATNLSTGPSPGR